ncbi:hypothetical protein G7Z17_g1704 [Cylindrodendrum hubeiense]|uniref:Aldehyde dehydrogenase domain-containing protein n=1 Tax=Cylindrodendrum hubeiense TaxID=595255 RepID=A0A9P5LF50_9HYPO|nr:hypothetical protein G7Z17_g1704 [Cylindrodendrum hubeiense]
MQLSLNDVQRKDLLQTRGLINGEWVDAISGSCFDVLDPASLNKLATLPEMGKEDTEKAIEAAHTAFATFKKTSSRQRARWLRKWNDLCLEHLEDLALILSLEKGKTIAEGRAEVTYGASFLECATLKKLSLELGGNSPFIVFDDANIDRAVDALLMAKFRNSGQTCVTANRIFVQVGIYDEFTQALLRKMKGFTVGPDAKRLGGNVLWGGAPITDYSGYFIQPTLITNMQKEMLTTREEVFAPVVGLYKFSTEEEVLELANDCEVGLGSFVMTESIARSWRVAEALEVGMVGINVGVLCACESPFGGVKESGYGREGGSSGIDEYMTVKSMLIDISE